MSPTYSVTDLVAVSIGALVAGIWVTVAGGSFSLLALIACQAVFFSFYLAGSLCAGWRSLAVGVAFDLPLRLLVGYGIINTLLFALSWLSPLGIVANFALLSAIAIALFVVKKPLRTKSAEGSVGLLAFGASLAAATLWCQDAIRPTRMEGDNLVFKPWIDGFYHAVHVQIFSTSHGWGSIEDWRLAGVAARLYHYGIYLTPALIKQVSGIQSYTAFGGLLVPMGVFFTGLGAYAMFASFWGRWPGLAACAALLLLPDGAEQGIPNPFMSYHWLTQISPGAPYGLALLAVAWLFVILGCTQGNRVQVLIGWLVGGLVVFYKAHFFIASALLLLAVPPLFFRGSFFGGALNFRKRVLLAAGALVLYVGALFLVQKVPGIPPVRFDGSSVGHVVKLVKGFTQPGAVRAFLDARIGFGQPLSANLFVGGPFVLFAALGLFVPLLALLAVCLRKRMPPLLLVFPFLIIANFLVMFLGLALDFTSSTPDELSHRPFVVMYFVVVAWIGGAAGLFLIEWERVARVARHAIVALTIAAMAVPAFLGAGVHRNWAMQMFSAVPVPMGLIRAATFIREHGDARDVFQDSGFDRLYAVAALAERRIYVSHTLTRVPSNEDLIEKRSAGIERFMQLQSSTAIAETAERIGLRWFLLDPDDRVEWPSEIATRPVFESNGFRVYKF